MSSDVIVSISKMVPNGNRLELPQDEHFANYAAVKKALTVAGGKYKKCGFEFSQCAKEIQGRLCGGEVINDKKKFQFFPTPDDLAQELIDLADIREEHDVLEPSAGQAAIACRIPDCRSITLVELNPENVAELRAQNYQRVTEGDFLQFEGGPFDRIVANPPFTKNQDIDHVLHMYELLKPGGRLVSIMSCSWTFGGQKKQEGFRHFVEAVKGEVVELEAGRFKESGTSVSSVIVVIDKP